MFATAAGKTDVGRSRSHNEDTMLLVPELGLYIVCDGMGGHAAGEVASEAAAAAVRDFFVKHRQHVDHYDGSPAALATLQALMRTAIEEASRTVFELARNGQGKHGMGTTCNALLVVGGKGVMGHVGDSRLYMVRNKRVYLLSVDHTYLNEAVRNGMMTPEQAAVSPYAHMVTRGVGVQNSVCVDTLTFDILPGDTLLQCSDGLYEYFQTEAEMIDLLTHPNVEGMPDKLIDLANNRGGKDNVTAVVLRAAVEQPTPHAEAKRVTEVTSNLDTLRLIGLFHDFDMQELVIALNTFRPAHFDAGAQIVTEGDKGESLFVIVEGQLQVIRSGKEMAMLTPGNHFGEMALLNRRPRSATVVAKTGCRLLRLDRQPFHELVASHASIGAKFLWKLAQNLSLRLDELYFLQEKTDVRKTSDFAGRLSPFRRGNPAVTQEMTQLRSDSD